MLFEIISVAGSGAAVATVAATVPSKNC